MRPGIIMAGATALAIGALAKPVFAQDFEIPVPFKDASECDGWFLLIFLVLCYGYVLFTAAGFIGDGSELLLLVPSVAGVVGSVVLPMLGALPDGAMLFFSGLGEPREVQEGIKTGMGALSGATVMQLCIRCRILP